MAFLIGSALPRLVHTSQVLSAQTTDMARSPGPGCDIGVATWTVQPDAPISLRRLSTGTQITAPQAKLALWGSIFLGEYAGAELPCFSADRFQ